MSQGPKTDLPPHPAPEGVGDGTDIRDFLAVLYRHRWSALLLFAVVAVVGTVRTLRETPVYECGAALLEMTSENTGIATLSNVLEQPYITQDHIETQIHLLRSEKVLRAAYEDCPEAGAKLPFGAFPGGVQATPVRNSFLVRVSFRSPHPEVNHLAANAVARAYIRVGREQREARTNRASEEFQRRRDEVRDQLEKAEEDIADYRTGHQIPDLRAAKANVDSLVADAERKYDQQQLDLVALEKGLAEVQAAREAGSLEHVGRVLQDPAYQEIERAVREAEGDRYRLLREYLEDAAEVKVVDQRLADLARKSRAIVEALVGQVETGYETAARAVEKVGELRDGRRKEQADLARLLIEQTNLEEKRARLRDDLDYLVQQALQVQATSGFDLSPALLQEEAAEARILVRPRTERDILVSILLGLALAVGACFLLEQFNDAALRPEEVVRATGLPILGMLPRLSGGGEGAEVSTLEDPKSEMAEAVRIIRTAILFSPSGKSQRRRILVTSAESGEGKTVLSANLAASLAQAGQRTLLVDGDLRRPRVHEVFGLDNEDGLTRIFAGPGEDPLPRSVGGDALPLSVLTSGPIPPNPAELLGGERIREFLDRVGEGCDRMILDSPPAGPVSDPALLSREVDGVLMVVRLGKTSVRAIRRAHDHLQKVGAPLLGVVINGASVGGGYNYHYYKR